MYNKDGKQRGSRPSGRKAKRFLLLACAIFLGVQNILQLSSYISVYSVSHECLDDGSFTPPTNIILDFDKIRKMDQAPLHRVKNLTTEEYVKFVMDSPGKEHYTLLSYISVTYGDCRHFVDIGTRYVASSLAMGSNRRSPVWTFDTPSSHERETAFRGSTEQEWQKKAMDVGVNITFHNLDLLKVSDKELRKYLGTWFVFLDTFHLPYTQPFEREFLKRVVDIGFKGLLGLDDIYLNDEMKQWWQEIKDNAEKDGYVTYDLTPVGHATGTGLLDFSGKVVIEE